MPSSQILGHTNPTMIHMELREAQLFRILVGLFGRDRVIFKMSALTVCGGAVPEGISLPLQPGGAPFNLASWAKSNSCLFTILNEFDEPYMVIDFFSGFQAAVDVREVEHQQYLTPLLRASGIRYITMSDDEFDDILDPDSSLDILSFLKAKIAGG